MAAKKSDTIALANSLNVEQLLAAAFNSTDSVRFIVAEDGTILYFNRKAYENGLLFHNKKLEKGDSLFDYANDTSNNVEHSLTADLARTFNGETFRVETEIKFGKESKWFETEYVPIFHKLKIAAASITIYEITDKKNNELDLAKRLIQIQKVHQNRLQKVEAMLDTVNQQATLIFDQYGKSAGTAITKNMKRLCASIQALQTKISG
jgi:PAS domain S-box-containing protein